MLITNWLITVNLITFLGERAVYYRYLVRKGKSQHVYQSGMSTYTASFKPHHNPVGWTLLSSLFTEEGVHSEGIYPGQVSQLPSLALQVSKDAPFSPLGQGCKAPNGVRLQNFQQKRLITESTNLLFDHPGFLTDRIYIVLKSPLHTHEVTGQYTSDHT